MLSLKCDQRIMQNIQQKLDEKTTFVPVRRLWGHAGNHNNSPAAVSNNLQFKINKICDDFEI